MADDDKKSRTNKPERKECPACGCGHFLDISGQTFRVRRVQQLRGATRRYKYCRNCGRSIRTRETIEKRN